MKNNYDFIFAGAGLSSLMTVHKMILSKKFEGKSILILDEHQKNTNNRTWSFWSEPNHAWEDFVTKKWDYALFANKTKHKKLDLSPFQYNMIKGLDFYNLIFEKINQSPNIFFKQAKILNHREQNDFVEVSSSLGDFTCKQLLNSIYDSSALDNQKKYPVLQQHFVGWFIKTKEEFFDSDVATFMDFSLEQNGNTKFMYVLPTSKKEALFEPTWFSHKQLKKEVYENEIIQYLNSLGIKDYEIVEKEQGSIPMTCFPFWQKNTKRILHIGTAGGWTKASTGFTFFYANKKTNQLIDFLSKKEDFKEFHKTNKFWFLDLIFLDVLDKKNELGSDVFSSLLLSGKTELVLRFLNEETNFFQTLRVMLLCPLKPFTKSLLRVVFKQLL